MTTTLIAPQPPPSGSSVVFHRRVAVHAAGKLIAALISAMWLVVAARYLPVSDFGDLAVILSVGLIVAVVSDLGLPFVLTQAAAAAGACSGGTVAVVAARRAAVAAFAAIGIGAAYLLVAHDTSLVIPELYAVSLIATAIHSTICAGFRGLGRFWPEATNDVMSRIGLLVVGWLILAAGGGLVAAVAVYAAADVGSVIALAWLASRQLARGPDGIDRDCLSFRRTGAVSAGRVLTSIYYRLDQWLIALVLSSTATAIYAAPYRILDGLQLLPRAIGAVAVTEAGEADRTGSRARSSGRLALQAALVVAIPALLLLPFAAPTIRLLFGDRFADGAGILRVLLLAAPPSAAAAALIPRASLQLQGRFVVVATVSMVGNVIANLIVLRRLGPIGAAWTTLVGQIALVIALVVMTRSSRPVREGSAELMEDAASTAATGSRWR
jgi:O-antigen/teichoic acid export membrane protein